MNTTIQLRPITTSQDISYYEVYIRVKTNKNIRGDTIIINSTESKNQLIARCGLLYEYLDTIESMMEQANETNRIVSKTLNY